MLMILLIALLPLAFGGGGGYYGYRRNFLAAGEGQAGSAARPATAAGRYSGGIYHA
jgi:hypothetical protein